MARWHRRAVPAGAVPKWSLTEELLSDRLACVDKLLEIASANALRDEVSVTAALMLALVLPAEAAPLGLDLTGFRPQRCAAAPLELQRCWGGGGHVALVLSTALCLLAAVDEHICNAGEWVGVVGGFTREAALAEAIVSGRSAGPGRFCARPAPTPRSGIVGGEIGTGSLHLGLPTKAALGQALITRYHQSSSMRSVGSGANRDARTKPREVRAAVPGGLAQAAYVPVRRPDRGLRDVAKTDAGTGGRVLQGQRSWLTGVPQEGRRAKMLRFQGPASATAAFLVSSLEGAMLVARSYGRVSRFESVAKKLIGDLATSNA